MNKPIVNCVSLGKLYNDGALRTAVFSGVNLSVVAGESLAIVGPSGSGKSTLLHILGGLDRPSEGEAFVQGERLSSLSEKARGFLRNRALGFIYQFHHLLPEFTALENVAMPLLVRRIPFYDASKDASELLHQVGLKDRLHHKPSELSGGERQRVAVARAMITRPACLLADEPTGNLDRDNAERVFDLIMSLNKTFNTSFIVVTHDTNLVKSVDSIRVLERGHLT